MEDQDLQLKPVEILEGKLARLRKEKGEYLVPRAPRMAEWEEQQRQASLLRVREDIAELEVLLEAHRVMQGVEELLEGLQAEGLPVFSPPA